MPIYEYVCDKCGTDFEELVTKASSNPVCPSCGSSSTRKLISAPVRNHSGKGTEGGTAPTYSGGGCAGCSGGNCGSCGH